MSTSPSRSRWPLSRGCSRRWPERSPRRSGWLLKRTRPVDAESLGVVDPDGPEDLERFRILDLRADGLDAERASALLDQLQLGGGGCVSRNRVDQGAVDLDEPDIERFRELE